MSDTIDPLVGTDVSNDELEATPVNQIGQPIVDMPKPLKLHPFLESITREGDTLGLVTRFEFNSLVQFVQALYNEGHPPEPEPTEAPVNVDVPFASQDGDQLHCTMGNWDNVPISYAYQWKSDGEGVGINSEHFILSEDDLTHTFVCVVTATNAIGSTEAPPSNEVVPE